jgi:periplasmic divalent cation tolerance protein
MDAIVVFSTTDSMELAGNIAGALVESGEAACVNILPGVRSIYRWEGRICDEGELLLVIKSTAGSFEAIRNRIKQLHTYRVPEIIAIPVQSGDEEYLGWIAEQTRGGRAP